ncbi:hydrolase [Geothrix limicola]|uniref:Hydrolase n=1 Tax=Geothrix limicola TaxID=2927978 RepID=A0ABQ5QHK3_9BACT|nr:alpha/beta hydrolase [Geothrix limicola]GLH74332.1 hydrolase [Geothrix limicola]
MRRRNVMGLTAALVAVGAISGCLPHPKPDTGAPSGAHAPMDAAAFHAARRFAETPFGRIAYVESGSGPAALFLHGFPLNGFQWRGALDRLSPYRRCIAPDFLALGHTEVAAGQGVAPADQAAMLVALLDKLGVASVDLIANDSGGAVAQLLVAHHPERVRTLLLTNCDAEPDCPPPAIRPVIQMSKAGTFVDAVLGPQLADKALARSQKGLGVAYSDPAHPTDEALECYLGPTLSSAKRKAEWHAYAIALEANALAGIEPALRRSTVPVRIVWGMADTIFSRDSPAYLDRTFGHSLGVRRLEDSRLFWPEERPDVIAEEALHLWGIR